MTPQRSDRAHAPGLLGRCLRVFVLCVALCPMAASAGTPIPYVGEFREQIEELFFEPVAADGESPAMRVSADKVGVYRDYLEKKLRLITAHVVTFDQVERGRGPKRAARAARKTDVSLALRVALSRLEGLRPDTDLATAYDTAASILMLDYATRSYTDPIGTLKIPVHVKNLMLEWSLPDGTTARGVDAEAGNLVNPANGSFYTREELAELVRGGSDLSELQPPPSTPFWRAKPDIASVDIVSNYLEGGDPVHEGLVAEFPPFEGAVVELDKVHRTQSKPKFDVFWENPECRVRPKRERKECRYSIKLKFGMETHADPPANALLAALGFNVDLSMHLRNVRVNLGKLSMQQVEKEWASYFDRQRMHLYYPLETVLAPGGAGRGRDEEGEYLVFQQAVAEVKAPEIERIGFFSFSHGLAAQNREARGLFVFNAWIANADMKDEENNKLSLRKDADGEWQMYLVQQDLGHTFGHVLPERAGAYPWGIVDPNPFSRWFGKLRGRIELSYLDLQDSGLEHTTTYADAKWMVRLIAQLTREQIETAVRLGHWPDAVARLLVEKLVNRRNQLVEVFGLEDEFALLPVDRHLTTADGAVVDGKLIQSRWEGSHVHHGEHLADLVRPMGRAVGDLALWAVQRGLGAIERIDPGRIDISGRAVVSPEILVQLERRVTLNPSPTGRFDQHLVYDAVALGFNVGVGYFGSAEGAWVKRYAMAYPVATRHDGLTGGSRLLSLLLPIDVARGDLPEKYVLLREDAFAAGVRVSSDDSGELFDVLGGVVSLNRVVRHRSVVDRRDEVPLVWVDRPEYWRVRARGFLKFAFIQIPFGWGEVARGELTGYGWALDPERLDVVAADGTPVIDRMIRFDDPREIGAIQLREPVRVTSHFDNRGLRWTLFFISADADTRDERITHATPAGVTLRTELQVERRRAARWQFLDNGEEQAISVAAYNTAVAPEPIDPKNSTVVVRYRVDDLLTHNDELDGYYQLLAGLGALRPSMARDFDAVDWEVSGEPGGRWTRLLTTASVHYRAEAIERLLALNEVTYWPRLADQLGISERRLLRLVDHVRRRDVRLGARGAYRARRRERAAILHSLSVLRGLAQARQADGERERLRLLVKAIERANFRFDHTFDPSVVAALHRSAGLDDPARAEAFFVRGRIARAIDDENNLPERRAIVGQHGKPDGLRETSYRFFPLTGFDLYHMLDWMRAEEPNASN